MGGPGVTTLVGLVRADAPHRNWESLIAAAATAYAEPHRHFHTDRHLHEAWGLGERSLAVFDGSVVDVRRLAWALLFHDFVYVPGASDNEARSAEHAARWMTAFGQPEREIACVRELILWTARHDPAAATTVCHQALFDADMGVLGLAPERYREYVRDVRAEYVGSGALSDSAFDLGRRAFLDALALRFQAGPFFFALGEPFEQAVRSNVDAERRGEC